MKRCPLCTRKRDRRYFSKNRAHSDGLATYCKDCQLMMAMEHDGTISLANRLVLELLRTLRSPKHVRRKESV